MIRDYSKGRFVEQTVSYESLMKKRVKKHFSFLQPIFEAVSNSLEATKGKDDTIVIRLKVSRSTTPDKYEFNSIEIEDTGCGFDQENRIRFYHLFDESKNLNNLGSGRIQYLHFFSHTEIRSVYYKGGKKKKRVIVFSTGFLKKEKTPIWEGIEEDAIDNEKIGTSVEFFLPLDSKDKENYENLTTDNLRDKVFTHYLGKFCINKGNVQNIRVERYIYGNLVENESRYIEDSDIPDVDFHDEVKVPYKVINDSKDGLIKLKETETFKIDSYILPSDIQKKNEIKLTSKNETIDVDNVDFSFVERAKIAEGKNMLCLISSDYLTNQDTDVRGKIPLYTKAQFLKKKNLVVTIGKQIFIDDVQDEVSDKISKHYPSINKIKEESNDDISQIVEDFSLDTQLIDNIGRKTGERATDFLSRYYDAEAELEKDNTQKMREIFSSLRTLDPSSKGFARSFNSKVSKVNSLIPVKNKSSLSKYISSRKAAMNMLKMIIDKDLECQLANKKRKDNEKLIHDLLFPQGSMDALESNLWMLNEDFIHFRGFSNFKIKELEVDGVSIIRDDLDMEEKRTLTEYNRDLLGNKPDILLFPEEHKCIIIELKSDTADPTKYLNQAVEYAGLLRAFAKDEFVIDNFYLYLIAERFNFERVRITSPAFKIAQYLDYVFLPNSPVYGGKRGEGALYMEVLKYSTLLKRAEIRNSIFSNKIFGENFDKDEEEK
jgi:hypothetical protein